MTNEQERARPIIVKRVKRIEAKGHGGSWKVAFADFATAMMAFFLLMWLIGNANEIEKQAISGYFKDPSVDPKTLARLPIAIGDGGANAAVIELVAIQPQQSIAAETDLSDTAEIGATNDAQAITEAEILRLAEQQEIAKLEKLKDQIQSLVNTSNAFDLFKDQVMVDIIPAGLRIQIVDREKRPMFDSGSSEPKFHSKIILNRLARLLTSVPNKLSITGHTDATPFVEREDYGNWELSSDRANAARRELMYGGVSEKKIARVEGFASSILFDQDKPQNPVNRRIAIIVLKTSAAEDIEKQVLGID